MTLQKVKELNKKFKNNFNYIINLSGHVDHKNKNKTLKSHFNSVENLVSVINKKKLFPEKIHSEEVVKRIWRAIYTSKENAICKAKSFYGDAKLKTTKFLINQYNLKNLPVTVFDFTKLMVPTKTLID